jgi:hypothetical protein
VELFYGRVGEVYDYSFGFTSFPLFIEFSSSCRDAPLFFTTVRPNRWTGLYKNSSFGFTPFPLFIEFSFSCRDAPQVRPNRWRWSNKGEFPHPHIFPVLVLGRTLGVSLQLDWTVRLDNRIGQPKLE